MRVVLDTNVFVSGLHWRGIPSKVLDACLSGQFELVTSLAIMDELEETLFVFKIPMDLFQIIWWKLWVIEKAAILVTVRGKINVVKDDPDDDKIIETAINGGADVIVTRDNHLLRLKCYGHIQIMTPEKFSELYLFPREV